MWWAGIYDAWLMLGRCAVVRNRTKTAKFSACCGWFRSKGCKRNLREPQNMLGKSFCRDENLKFGVALVLTKKQKSRLGQHKAGSHGLAV